MNNYTYTRKGPNTVERVLKDDCRQKPPILKDDCLLVSERSVVPLILCVWHYMCARHSQKSFSITINAYPSHQRPPLARMWPQNSLTQRGTVVQLYLSAETPCVKRVYFLW